MKLKGKAPEASRFLLSIVIPFYKKEYFQETLQSLANQTNLNFNIYIGDDASPDDPVNLTNSYDKKLNITYRRFRHNLGGTSLTQQWKRCINLIGDEEWIMVLGDDDFLAPNVVEAFYDQLPNFNGKVEVIRFATQLIREDPKFISSIYTHPVLEKVSDSYTRKINNVTRSSLSEYIFSKKTYLEFGFYPYPLGWYSDDRAWFEFSAGKPIYSINDAIISIRNSPFNISSSKNNLNLKKKAKREFFKFLISRKMALFDNSVQIKILRAYEETFSIVPFYKIKQWGELFYFNLKYYDSYQFKKFIKRRIHSIKIFD